MNGSHVQSSIKKVVLLAETKNELAYVVIEADEVCNGAYLIIPMNLV